jgi:hypothetical protein
MKKLLAIAPLALIMSCTQAQINTAWQIANQACIAAETSDPVIATLIPAWGPDVETVVAIICAIPSVISDFEGLPVAQAQLKTKLRLTTMSQVMPSASTTKPIQPSMPAASAAPSATVL